MGNEYQHFLMHHGIKGQKWGKRNGPPYPLKEGQKSAAEKEATSDVAGSLAPALVLTALMAAPAAVMTAQEAITQHRANKKMKAVLKDAEEKSNDKRYASERENEEIDPETGLYLTGKKMTDEENMERINPSFDTDNEMFKVNCTACTMAMELRERGYDVHAGTDGKDMVRLGGVTDAERAKKWYTGEDPYKNVKRFRTSENGVSQFKSEIQKDSNARGEVCFSWKCGGGHSVFYKTDDKGNLTVYDTQSGKKMSDADLTETISNARAIEYTRLDQATPNYQYLKDNNYIC